jgi:hypothetical protein
MSVIIERGYFPIAGWSEAGTVSFVENYAAKVKKVLLLLLFF